MRIIVAGAGEVGTHLAKMLGNEYHDIVVIDPKEDRIRNVSQVADLITIQGTSTSIVTLQKASIHKADLFIAVNPSEEQDMNITSSILAKRMGAKKVVARINNDEYLLPENREVFADLGIDYLLYPEKIAAREIISLLGQTGATEYIDFSGKLQMIVIRLEEGAPIVDQTLEAIMEHSQSKEYLVVAIDREGEMIIPKPSEEFKLHDMVYIMSTPAGVSDVMQYTGKINIDVNSLMILGGSPTAIMVAQALEDKKRVKLVDSNREKCLLLAEQLEHTLIINADGRNMDAMLEEDLSEMDAFVALTSSSETNILACMAAKRAGVKKTIAEIENIDYIKLAESVGVDTVINKKVITAGRIFRFTMNADVQAIKCLTGSDAEVLEFIAKPNSPVTRAKIKYINFPKDAIIGGIIRSNQSFIATPETEIKPYDRIAVLSLPAAINKVGKYFG